jgi:DNA-binding response OmpR family regulator
MAKKTKKSPPHLDAVVAIINTSPDTVDMLKGVMQQAGFTVVTGYVHDIRDGRLDFEAFIAQHDPAAIIWDIAIPYETQWRFFQHMKRRQICGRCQFVLTTTNAEQVRKIAGRDELLYEIVGKTTDLRELVQAVKEAVRARPTR